MLYCCHVLALQPIADVAILLMCRMFVFESDFCPCHPRHSPTRKSFGEFLSRISPSIIAIFLIHALSASSFERGFGRVSWTNDQVMLRPDKAGRKRILFGSREIADEEGSWCVVPTSNRARAACLTLSIEVQEGALILILSSHQPDEGLRSNFRSARIYVR